MNGEHPPVPTPDSFYGLMYQFMGQTTEALKNTRGDIDKILASEEKSREASREEIKDAEEKLHARISTVADKVTAIDKRAAITEAKVVGYGAGAAMVVAVLWKVATAIWF